MFTRRAPGVFQVLLLSALLVAGCAGGPPKDVTLKGSLQASEGANPDANGRPSPVVVKIFQLQGNARFEQADFFPLFENTQATLAEDLLGVEEVILKPGDYRPYQGEFDPETRYIGVAAGFRDINQAQWKSIMEMPDKSITKFMKRGPLVIRVERLSITVASGE